MKLNGKKNLKIAAISTGLLTTALTSAYAYKEDIAKYFSKNDNNTEEAADNNQENISTDTNQQTSQGEIINNNETNKNLTKLDILSGGDGDLKIDRTTYKITCENCSANAELDGTLKLLNNTPITDVNKATVVAAFMWIEDNLPENQQLNNKLAILVKYGNDEETITDMREGNNPFRYDYNNVNPQITDIMNWFDTQSASPLAFISRLMNDYGITTKPKAPTKPTNPLANFDYKAQGVSDEEWNKLSQEDKEAFARVVGYDVNEFANNSDVIKHEKAITDSLQRIVDRNKGN